jgi:hypothetical protein
MVNEKSLHRMTLRQRMTHAEKCARDLIEHVQSTLLPRHNDFRDLSRPVRRRSHYPTLLAILNSLNKLQQAADQTQALSDYLSENLEDIRQHARRERANRR